MPNRSTLDVDKWVIRRRVDLGRQDRMRVSQIRSDRSQPLSRTPQGVPILPQDPFVGFDIDFLFVVDRESTPFEQRSDVLGYFDLIPEERVESVFEKY